MELSACGSKKQDSTLFLVSGHGHIQRDNYRILQNFSTVRDEASFLDDLKVAS
jgi:hypothetical protein